MVTLFLLLSVPTYLLLVITFHFLQVLYSSYHKKHLKVHIDYRIKDNPLLLCLAFHSLQENNNYPVYLT
uniref:Uncharacterized protein n=1 Tax=Siphoviridae sp. ctrpg19 TaxID=2826481 RepID=A0A8S5MKH6_9CAUD|nr:MAG TPA: hypothetical protein [Siphoviridae sp. ctrpg19]